ncbi:MAG: hypothetical protein JWL95_2049 [Gemmatimonadetes bacterium]|nr:hypothetical protein [Gemmatimonadota bacterium]
MADLNMPPRNTSDDVVTALGELVLSVSWLEETLHDAIWLLSGADNRAVQILTAGLPFRTLIEKLGAIAVDLRTSTVPADDVIAYCKHLDALNERRNTIIHSAWHLDADEGNHRRFKRSAKPKSGFSLNVRPIAAADIYSLAREFRDAERKLWEIVP